MSKYVKTCQNVNMPVSILLFTTNHIPKIHITNSTRINNAYRP